MEIVKHFSELKKGIIWESYPRIVPFIMDEETNRVIVIDELNGIGSILVSQELCAELKELVSIYQDTLNWNDDEIENFIERQQKLLNICEEICSITDPSRFKSMLTKSEYSFLNNYASLY